MPTERKLDRTPPLSPVPGRIMIRIYIKHTKTIAVYLYIIAIELYFMDEF